MSGISRGPVLSGRTMRSSSFLFLSFVFLLASMVPFSQSETVPGPSLNGSFSSTVEGPFRAFRFFRLSDHMPHKYNTPRNTEYGEINRKSERGESGRTEESAYHGSNDDSPLFRTFDLLLPANIYRLLLAGKIKSVGQ